MSKAFEFIKECGVFWVLTTNGNSPAGRPFGAIMECNDELYISTANTKAVYKQLKENEQVQILALKADKFSWLRVNGIATECNEQSIKQRMLDECPALTNHFPTADVPYYSVFRIHVTNTEIFE